MRLTGGIASVYDAEIVEELDVEVVGEIVWRTYYSKATGVANCTGEFSVTNPLHPSLNNRH